MNLEQINRHIQERQATHLERVQEFIRQPSVSGQNLGVKECAHLLARYFRELAGCQRAEVVPTKGHPVVLGRHDAGAARTLLVYIMYDTQPFDEPGWSVPPLEGRVVPLDLPSGRVEALMARGAINTKGPTMAFLNAVDSIRAVEGHLPVNLIFMAEGEEELGSPHLPDFVASHLDELQQGDACYFPMLSQDVYGKVRLYLGCKGICYLEMECSGAVWGRGPQEYDIHSSNKAWVDSPAWRLIHALATMTDATGNCILVEGLYDDVAPPSPEEERLLRELVKTFDLRDAKEMMRVKLFSVEEREREALLRAYFFGTTLNIDGIWGGYTGPGTKTVLPHKVTAKLDIRLVPNQRPEKVLPLLRRHLDRHGYRDIVLRQLSGYSWSRTDYNAPVVQALLRALEGMGHKAEVWPRLVGSAPFYLFSEVIHRPFISGALGHGGRAHSPNEYLVHRGNGAVAGLAEVEQSMVRFLAEFASV